MGLRDTSTAYPRAAYRAESQRHARRCFPRDENLPGSFPCGWRDNAWFGDNARTSLNRNFLRSETEEREKEKERERERENKASFTVRHRPKKKQRTVSTLVILPISFPYPTPFLLVLSFFLSFFFSLLLSSPPSERISTFIPYGDANSRPGPLHCSETLENFQSETTLGDSTVVVVVVVGSGTTSLQSKGHVENLRPTLPIWGILRFQG